MHVEQWLATQNRVLEQLSAGEPLPVVLHYLTQELEQVMSGSRCVVMLADEKNEQLRSIVAPSMPAAFHDDARLAIRDGHGAGGTAAASRRPIICDDVRTDPNWAPYREFAETYNIRACWSTPIPGRERVLGTVMVIYDQPVEPDASQQLIIDTCSRLVGLAIDRHHRETALRESEQRFRSMADAVPVLVWMSGTDKKSYYFNTPWLDFTGRTMEQEADFGWTESIHPDDRAHSVETYLSAFDRREPFSMEYRLRRHDGVYRWFLDQGAPRYNAEGEFVGYIGSCIDITDRRNAEQELRASESRLRFTLEAARIGTWQWDIATNALEWSDNLAELHGQSPSELTGRFDDFLRHIAPGHRDRVLSEIHHAIENQTPYDTEYPTMSADGQPGWMAVRGQVVYGSNGEAVQMTGVCVDVTARREAEAQLQAHARQQATVAELGQRALVGEDLQALLEETTRRVADTLDVPMTKVLQCEPDGRALRLRAGVGWKDGLVGEALVRVAPESQAGYTLLHDEPVIVKHLPSETRFVGMRLLHDHGVISGMSVVIPGVGGKPWGVFGVHSPEHRVFIHDDINFLQATAYMLSAAIQRKASEHKLRALNETLEQRVAERTAVAEHRATQLRALAAELAQAERRERRRLSQLLHDHLQQLLVAAKLRIDALTNPGTDDDLHDVANQIDQLLEQAIEASRSLTVELSPPILYDAGLPAAIEWLCRWMHDKHGLTVGLNMDVAKDQKLLASEAGVFLFDAVRELLFNVVKHAGVRQAELHVSHQQVGPLHVTVVDHGQGFDASQKEADVTASGFGLFNIQERIELLGGRMDIHSEPGQGTRIDIELDVASGQTSPQAVDDQSMLDFQANGRRSAPMLGTSGSGTPMSEGNPDQSADNVGTAGAARPIRVLVADDHAPLRNGLITLLVSQPDIQVVGDAVDGEMAIDMAQRLRPDVLLMDIHMPGMNGIEATRRLTEVAPDVRVVGLSIEEHEEMARAMRDAGAVAYLPKGSPPAELFAIIRRDVAAVTDAT